MKQKMTNFNNKNKRTQSRERSLLRSVHFTNDRQVFPLEVQLPIRAVFIFAPLQLERFPLGAVHGKKPEIDFFKFTP